MTDFDTSRRLAGGAKNLIDDIAELNRKVPEQMTRGLRDGYLDETGIDKLVAKLGVEAPRIKREFTIFYETRTVHSFKVSAFDRDEAMTAGAALIGRAARNQRHVSSYRQSHWVGERSQDSLIALSEAMWDRPTRNREPIRFYDRLGNLMPLPGQEPAQPENMEAPAPAQRVGTAIHESVERMAHVGLQVPEQTMRDLMQMGRLQAPRPQRFGYPDDNPS